ncbi:MAG: threonine aldolase [Clostridiales bacterium GWB2_37_7]|nr:MAG: threonine aldolase [Clostridiales bacterium GWB2_37_7]
MRYIDFRSDTVTIPTEEMRKAMAEAVVGDDVYGDDPTVIELETLAADLMGKEAAMFVPSGTMGNQLAIMTHTRRGDEIIVEESCHIVEHEVGAVAVLSGVNLRTVKGINSILQPKDVEAAIREEDIHHPETTLICMENALSNGRVVPLENMQQIYHIAKKHNIAVHLDGARIFNAAAYLNVEAKDIAAYTDTVMFCLSKGLCAPIGSMVAGSKSFISKAKKNRKLIGGGMRQSGILAAAGLIALKDMTKRLHIDHENAKYLADKLSELPGVKVDKDSIHINMVFFTIDNLKMSDAEFIDKLYEKGIKANGAYRGVLRFVTNNDVARKDIDYAMDCINVLL